MLKKIQRNIKKNLKKYYKKLIIYALADSSSSPLDSFGL